MASETATEGGHWYRADGSPCYTIPKKNGDGERATTIRDARELGLLPSVTGIINCADKPGLNNWKADQLLLAGLTLPRLPDEPETAWLARVKKDSKETGKNAASRGTDLHTAIEKVLLGEPVTEWADHARGALAAVAQWCGSRQDWKPERSFAHPLGFGGKVDLHNPEWVVDYKSKEFASVGEVKLWEKHFMQLAAYRHGLLVPNARCAIVFVSRTVPGLSTILECSNEEIEKGWRMFKALLDFWQARNGWPWQVAA